MLISGPCSLRHSKACQQSPFYSLWLHAVSLRPSVYLADFSVHESSFHECSPLPEFSAALPIFYGICSLESLVFPSELKHLRKVKKGISQEPRVSNSGNRKHFREEEKVTLLSELYDQLNC